MILNIYNLPGRDELKTKGFWAEQANVMMSYFDYPEMFGELWIDIYHRDHADKGDDLRNDRIVGLYTHGNKRVRVFARPDNLPYYLDVLGHEIGHYIGHKIGFIYGRTHIELKLTEKFKELIPEKTEQNEYFATHAANIANGRGEYSDQLKTLFKLAWPVKKHLENKIFESLSVRSNSVIWQEYEIEQFFFWPQLKFKGWFGMNSSGQLQKYVSKKWINI